MYRGQQSKTEVDDIWREKAKNRGTLQSQQLQMATERGSLVGITSEKEVRRLKNTHSPHLAMHLSMEDMILNQLDLIWENYLVSTYNSYYSDGLFSFSAVSNVNNCTYNPLDIAQISSGPLYEHSRELCKTSVVDIGFSSIYGIFTEKPSQVMWKSYLQGAIIMKNPSCKRKLSASLDGAEKRAKRSVNMNKSGDLSPYFMDSNAKTNVDFISPITTETEDEDRFVKPCQKIEASSETNISTPMLRSAQETGCNVKPGSKMSVDGCYFGSVLKSLVISSSSLGVTEEVFSSTFIPQTDSSVDYTGLCGSLQQRGRCKVLADSDKSLCLTNTTDSHINLHVRLSVHPCIPTSDVILCDVNCTDPGERQGQNCFDWPAREKRRIQDETVIAADILKSSQVNKSSLPNTDKKNRYCGNNDKSLLPRGKTFSTRLNYPKQHFLQDMNFSIFAASLLGTSKNDFPFFHSTRLQRASPTESSHETTDETFPLTHKSLKYVQAEVEVSLGTENINNSSGRTPLDYKSALSKQDFCFPSHFQKRVDTEQSEKETSGNNVDFYRTCAKQVSYTERFQKICLEKCLVESESNNSTEMYCSFRKEMLFYKGRSRQDNIITIEDKPSECKSKYLNIKQPHKHESRTKEAEDKEHNEEVISGNVSSDVTHNRNIKNSSICEKVMEDVAEGDVTFNHLDGVEESQHRKLDVSEEHLSRSRVSSMCVETIVNGKSKQECDSLTKAVLVTKKNTDVHSAGSKVLLKNEDFEMKAQFDLVLEELKMFHTIGEENVDMEIEQEDRMEPSCSNTTEDGIKENVPSNEVIVSRDSEVLVTKKDHICDRKTTKDSEMKAQFDLVLEELKMFHTIGEENVDMEIEQDDRMEPSCSNTTEDGIKENVPSNEVIVSRDSEVLVTKKDYICDRKTTKVNEEVPRQYTSSVPGDEESLYSADTVEDIPKSVSWTPAFVKSGDREANMTSHNEKAVTFSHGIGRVTPLTTRTGPLRIGLSKKAKIKQLHPYLR